MHYSTKNVVLSLTALIYGSVYASDHAFYAITMGCNDTLKISLNCYQKIDSTTKPGEKVNFPHLWRLEGLLSQSLIQLSDETRTTSEGKAYRVYDVKEGHKKYSTANALGSLMLMPVFFLGFLTLTPYEQDYLFQACAPGTVRLTFICEKRYCWEEPTKVASVDITVIDTPKTKNRTLSIQ